MRHSFGTALAGRGNLATRAHAGTAAIGLTLARLGREHPRLAFILGLLRFAALAVAGLAGSFIHSFESATDDRLLFVGEDGLR